MSSQIAVQVEGQTVFGEPKQFSTGSRGWNVNGKVMIDGQKCQFSGNVIIIGSKTEQAKPKVRRA